MSRVARHLAWILAVILVSQAVPSAGQGKDDKKLEQAQRAETQALVSLVDDLAMGKPAGAGYSLKWEQAHFIKAQGEKTYVPFTVAVEPGSPAGQVAMYFRVAKRGEVPTPPTAPAKDDKKAQAAAKQTYAFEDVYFFEVPAATAGQPQRIRRAFAVDPGDYDLYIAMREQGAAAGATPKSGALKQELTVPNLAGNELTLSSIIVAEKVDILQAPVANERQAENPYTFGTMKVTPSIANKFSKKDELALIFWIYGAGLDTASKKPNLTIDYNFHQKTADGEKYFNKTEPQELNAQTLPPQFDQAAGHQLPGNLAVPLASFPEGEFRLEIKVQDKVSGKSLNRDVNFTVAGQ
jgi:hypothetical protein